MCAGAARRAKLRSAASAAIRVLGLEGGDIGFDLSTLLNQVCAATARSLRWMMEPSKQPPLHDVYVGTLTLVCVCGVMLANDFPYLRLHALRLLACIPLLIERYFASRASAVAVKAACCHPPPFPCPPLPGRIFYSLDTLRATLPHDVTIGDGWMRARFSCLCSFFFLILPTAVGVRSAEGSQRQPSDGGAFSR